MKRTKEKFQMDISMLEKQLLARIGMHKNSILVDMWNSILDVLKQSETGLVRSQELGESNLARVLQHLANTTSVQPRQSAAQVYHNVSLDMERAAVKMEGLAAALRMVLVRDLTLGLFVVFLLLWPPLIFVWCFPYIRKWGCSQNC